MRDKRESEARPAVFKLRVQNPKPSIKQQGIGMSLGISTNLEAVTARYVDVRLERKQEVLDTYHKAVHATGKNAVAGEPTKKAKKKSSDIEL